jgi:hydrogenase maturation protease
MNALEFPAQIRQPVVEVLVCGSPDRGDDSAALIAAALIADQLPADVGLRVVGQLDIDDLLSSPARTGLVIVDAATGIRPGHVVDLPLTGLVGSPGEPRPRSSHALSLAEVIALAELIRDEPVRGRIVAIGAAEFGLGADFSLPVAAGIPALASAILEATEDVQHSARFEARS